jgi:preprotein translocase subunit SecD
MGKNLNGKIGFIVAVLVIFLYGIIGIPHGGLKQSLTDRIHLGLDLKGGTHLVLKVHVSEAINSATDRDMQRLNTELAPDSATAAKPDPAHPETIAVSGSQPAQRSAVNDVLKGTEYSGYEVSTTPTGFNMTMTQDAIRTLESSTLDQSIETIRQRIDSLGVSEPVIERYGLGENQILVQLPGVSPGGR